MIQITNMNQSMICKFCQREPARSQCPTCKRWVCMQCAGHHNCYPRER